MDVDRASLLVVFAIAAAAPIVADVPRRVRVPIVVVEIALGILAGPQLLHLARADGLVTPLAELGLAVLFFLAGLEVDLAELRGHRGGLAIRAWVASLGLGMAVGAALWGAGLIGAPVFVGLALTTTAFGALVPILRDAALTEGRLGRHAIALAAVGELGPVVALSLILALVSGQPWRSALLVAFAAIAVATGFAATRVRATRIEELVLATMHSSGQLAIRLCVLLLAGFFFLADGLGLDVILGAFTAGLVVGRVAQGERRAEFTTKVEAIGYGFLVPIFFVATGLRFDFDGLVGDAANLVLVPAFALLFVAVRGLPVLALYRHELPGRERASLSLLSASALPLVVAITQIAVERGQLAEDDAVALVGAGMLSLLVFPATGIGLARERASPVRR